MCVSVYVLKLKHVLSSSNIACVSDLKVSLHTHTQLWEEAANGNADVVETLVRGGANIEYKDATVVTFQTYNTLHEKIWFRT